jgi:hypothetical protein
LQRLSNWPEWDKSFDKQLDAHHRDGALGPPVLIADLTSSLGHRPKLLRFHWTCVVKPDGTRKARACMIDGSKRAAPWWLRDNAPTYASCVKQPAMKLFFCLCALYCFIVTIGNTDNTSHAACQVTRRSVTGYYAFCLAGAVVAYKSKLQPVVATLSTEAEFYAAVIAGKLAKYLRSILRDLLIPPSQPTILYEDKQ